METGIDEQRVIIEAIATLVNIRQAMADLILKPSGVPKELYQPLLARRDENTGRPLSKRQLAPLIIDSIEKRLDSPKIFRAILNIAAKWDKFHLANDEYAARATVQKAREVWQSIELLDEEHFKEKERVQREDELSRRQERADIFKKESSLLLLMFDELHKSDDPHKRGYLLQDLLKRIFDLHQINVMKSFTRNTGAEQIDGAFRLEGWHYLVECRWRGQLADIRELDGLKGQIDRSGKQTMGLFLSINGWSKNVPPLLKQNPDKSIILMNGYDLRSILHFQVDLKDFILTKLAKLNLESEPFYGISEYFQDKGLNK